MRSLEYRSSLDIEVLAAVGTSATIDTRLLLHPVGTVGVTAIFVKLPLKFSN